jgi:hypothetical protein
MEQSSFHDPTTGYMQEYMLSDESALFSMTQKKHVREISPIWGDI